MDEIRLLYNNSVLRTVTWTEIQYVQRDICFLYHELAKYSYIMGDLAFGALYTLPYWDFLSVTGIDAPTAAFVRDGCLVMLLALAWEIIDQAGNGLPVEKRALCQAAITELRAHDQQTGRLIAAVQHALALASSDDVRQADLLKHVTVESDWVHVTYVRGYFEQAVHQFRTNPYYR